MSPAQAEALFSSARLEPVYLTAENAGAAGMVLIGAPAFCQEEYEMAPDTQLAVDIMSDLLTGPLPPGVSRGQVFPIGMTIKGQPGFIGIAHMMLGFPGETELTIGLMVIAESHQKKGYGKEFITGLYDWARPQGIGFIRINCHPRHKGSTAFLDKLGFADLGTNLKSGHAVWTRKLPATEDD